MYYVTSSLRDRILYNYCCTVLFYSYTVYTVFTHHYMCILFDLFYLYLTRQIKSSKTTMEAAYGREMNIQISGYSSGGHSCSQHANCTLLQNLRHLWHCVVWHRRASITLNGCWILFKHLENLNTDGLKWFRKSMYMSLSTSNRQFIHVIFQICIFKYIFGC